ncbi:hypothetical protein BH10PSE6_BH10PSE6_44840 [soil metagenome]
MAGSTHELERTLSEGWRTRAGWTAHDQRTERALDDGPGRGRTGRAHTAKRACWRLRSAAADRPQCGPVSRPRARHLPSDEHRQVGARPRALHRQGGHLSTRRHSRCVTPRGTANDAMPVALVRRRDLGADPRSGNIGDTGRSRRSSGLMKKKRFPRAGERVKVGRRLVTVPGVRSMTDPDPVAPTTKSGVGEPERPTDELSEELTRTVKAAYQ